MIFLLQIEILPIIITYNVFYRSIKSKCVHFPLSPVFFNGTLGSEIPGTESLAPKKSQYLKLLAFNEKSIFDFFAFMFIWFKNMDSLYPRGVVSSERSVLFSKPA
jgi:hypothetical protein